MTKQHTPGPWGIADSVDIVAPSKVRPGIDSGQAVVAIAQAHLGLSGKAHHMTDLTIDDAEAEANARLIAAAPDLLAALESATTMLEADGYDVSDQKAAIAKANGGA